MAVKNPFAPIAFPGLAQHLLPYADAARKRYDKGDYWWELRACDYYDAFDRPKIFWPDIAKLPRFSWDDTGKYINNTGYIMPSEDHALLGILQSRVIWFAISQICQPLRLRAGLWQYRVLPQFAGRLPIPEMPDRHRDIVSNLASEITLQSKARYTLHRQTRHRIVTDLGTPHRRLNQRLTAWWDLDFSTFRREIAIVFKHDIPLKQRDEWEAWLAGQRSEHLRLTADIVRLETDLNAHVYELFDLTPSEVKVIEESTKYRYGEV